MYTTPMLLWDAGNVGERIVHASLAFELGMLCRQGLKFNDERNTWIDTVDPVDGTIRTLPDFFSNGIFVINDRPLLQCQRLNQGRRMC